MAQVKDAYLHQAITIPGTKINGVTSLSHIKFPKMELHWDGSNLSIKENGTEAVVPGPNVACVIFHPEVKKAKQ